MDEDARDGEHFCASIGRLRKRGHEGGDAILQQATRTPGAVVPRRAGAQIRHCERCGGGRRSIPA